MAGIKPDDKPVVNGNLIKKDESEEKIIAFNLQLSEGGILDAKVFLHHSELGN